ncbi:hypothetical protein O7623_25670 [Solwaraspora sp. WMMD791]|uniref:hypothetical protein n=1 Tax=Solwaraspora sp. WMMD791 TaxID=3016086 RepID=UPI00249BB3D8|nr:hypothetical protein [Solwaraspora sp. WMMD791]WFE26647.1 hypothetical protein O7623_25670 [Solwaraspora sp. WMMD791]
MPSVPSRCNSAARAYGMICAAVLGAGRKPRRRLADLMIASVAVANGLPLYTTNPDDFIGLTNLVDVRQPGRRAVGPASLTARPARPFPRRAG